MDTPAEAGTSTDSRAKPPVKSTHAPKKLNGAVVIVGERCKGCGFCIEFCPTDALKFSDQYNAKGYHPPLLISRDLCSGCNMCGLLCPDFAIYGFVTKKKTK